MTLDLLEKFFDAESFFGRHADDFAIREDFKISSQSALTDFSVDKVNLVKAKNDRNILFGKFVCKFEVRNFAGINDIDNDIEDMIAELNPKGVKV